MKTLFNSLLDLWHLAKLRSQLVILSTLTITCIMLINAYYSSTRQSNEEFRRMTERAIAIEKNIVQTAEYMIINNDFVSLENFLEKTAEHPGIQDIQVMDKHGMPYGHIIKTPDNKISPSYSLARTSIPALPQKSDDPLIMQHDNKFSIWARIGGIDNIGWVRMEYNHAYIDLIQMEIWKSNIFTSAVMILINLFVFAVLLRLPTRAIKKATQFATNLTSRQGEIITVQGGSSEINTLVSSLNKTSKALLKQTQTIISGNNHLKKVTEELTHAKYVLEQRVDEHTQQLSWQAAHDPLTQLVNRREFEKRVNEHLLTTHTEDREHSICFLDLDQFKVINDTCGHIAGDELLKQIAGLLERTIRKSDTLARLGGDEFGILLPDCTIEMAEKVSTNILEEMRGFRFTCQSKVFKVTTSIGIAPITREIVDSIQLMSNADLACYSSKEKGGNRTYIYNEDDGQMSQRRNEMNWVARINKALDEGSFALYRQVIRPISQNGNPTHFEILVRMLGENNELIYPDTFIPSATRYKLMPLIDRLVINKTFEHCHEIVKQGNPLDAIYTINLSGDTMSDPCILNYIRDKLVNYRLPGPRFCFEITETAVIADLNGALHFIRELKKLGCRFALDDFGTGLSSFSYLKVLPIDYLKIDGSFVRDIDKDPMDRAIVESIHRMAHVVGLKTIAEFVENATILAILKEIGVDYVQGYGIGRPEPIPVLEDSDRALA